MKRSRPDEQYNDRYAYNSSNSSNNKLVQQQSLNLQVVGRKCKLHRNDNLARQIEQGKHLIILHCNNNLQHNDGLATYFDKKDESVETVGANANECQERLVLGKLSSSSSFSNDDTTSSRLDADANDNKDTLKCDNGSNYDDHVNAWIEIIHPPPTKGEECPSSSTLHNHRKQVTTTSTVNKPVFVDRYDVRVLLPADEYLYQQRHAQHDVSSNNNLHEHDYSWDDDLSEEQGRLLNMERFGDLIVHQSPSVVEMEDGRNPCDESLFDEGKSCQDGHPPRLMRQRQQQLYLETQEILYHPSKEEMSMIPKGMILPKTHRMYQIMKITATKSYESLQFEVFLKVKQQDNIDFQFLKSDHELYSFYQWLKDRNHRIKHKSRNETSISDETTGLVDSKTSKKEQTMDLLEMYSTTSSDDESSKAEEIKCECATQEDASCKDTSSQEESFQTEQVQRTEEKRLQRLKRAKMLREHFANL